MSTASKITSLIQGSQAYDNPCFHDFKSRNDVPVAAARLLARNWFEISLEFGKSIACFSGVLVSAMEHEESVRGRNTLKSLLQEVHRIAAHDLGLYEGAVDGQRGPLHSDMWVNMCGPLGSWRQCEVFPETEVLARSIRNALRTSSLQGLAMVRVVEGTALEIPKAMQPFFLSVRENGSPVFSEGTIEYVRHHEILEHDHEAVSGSVVDRYVEAFPQLAEPFTHAIAVDCALFGLFWERIRKEIYG